MSLCGVYVRLTVSLYYKYMFIVCIVVEMLCCPINFVVNKRLCTVNKRPIHIVELLIYSLVIVRRPINFVVVVLLLLK